MYIGPSRHRGHRFQSFSVLTNEIIVPRARYSQLIQEYFIVSSSMFVLIFFTRTPTNFIYCIGKKIIRLLDEDNS
jgi:hypothetical protein